MVNPDNSLKVGPWSMGGTGAEVNVSPLWQLVRKNFYVRHTKESISEEYDVPEVGTHRNTGCGASVDQARVVSLSFLPPPCASHSPSFYISHCLSLSLYPSLFSLPILLALHHCSRCLSHFPSLPLSSLHSFPISPFLPIANCLFLSISSSPLTFSPSLYIPLYLTLPFHISHSLSLPPYISLSLPLS